MIATLGGWLLVLLVVLSLISRHVTARRHTVVVLATLAPSFALVALVAALVLWIAGSTAGLVVALSLVAVILVIQLGPYLRRRTTGQTALTIMTCNVLVGRGDPQGILAVALEQGADLVALQETPPEWLAELEAAGIDEHFPHRVLAPAPLWDGVAVWSRHPLTETVLTTHGALRRISVRVGLDPARPELNPTVICVHIDSPWPNDPSDWVDQLAELRADLRERAGTVIAVGDYNATLDHQPFRRLLGDGYSDASVTARAWWARTWPDNRGVPPLIFIDHVVSRGMRATSVRTARIQPSDHRAVIARLART